MGNINIPITKVKPFLIIYTFTAIHNYITRIANFS